MVDVNVWRARIGRFYSRIRRQTVSKHRKWEADNGKTEATLNDILVFSLLIYTVWKCVPALLSNIWTGNIDWSNLSLNEHEIETGTMAHWQSGYLGKDTDISLQSRFVPHVTAIFSMCVVNAVLTVWRILLSNDVQVNPGPRSNEAEKHVQVSDKTGAGLTETVTSGEDGRLLQDKMSEILVAIQRQTQQIEEQNKQLAELTCKQTEHNRSIRELKEEQDKQSRAIRGELVEIKQDLGKVSEKCEEINQRCNKLESDNIKVTDKIEDIFTDLSEVRSEALAEREERARVNEQIESLRSDVSRMVDEIDRLEEFSRRDNLRMFGIQPLVSGTKEDYDACARAVCRALNEVEEDRQWVEEDIVRAHRVGQDRRGEPKVMIVRFQKWRDKMRLIRDKDFRAKLERIGVRVANDLTRRQADFVAKARSEGKSAFFVKGKMTMGPRRLDSRNDAERVEKESVAQETNIIPTHTPNSMHPSTSTVIPHPPTVSNHSPPPHSENIPPSTSLTAREVCPTPDDPGFDQRDRSDTACRPLDEGGAARPEVGDGKGASPAGRGARRDLTPHTLASQRGRQQVGLRAGRGSPSGRDNTQQAVLSSYLRGQPSDRNKAEQRSGRSLRSTSSSSWK